MTKKIDPETKVARAIIKLLKASTEPLAVGAVAEALKLERDVARKALLALRKQGLATCKGERRLAAWVAV